MRWTLRLQSVLTCFQSIGCRELRRRAGYSGCMRKICQRCHARLGAEASETASACPACGGALIADPADHPAEQQEAVDHRGIVLPPRHAVGGIITPW